MSRRVRVFGVLALAVVLAAAVTAVSAGPQPNPVRRAVSVSELNAEEQRSKAGPPEPLEFSVVEDVFQVRRMVSDQSAIYIVQLEDPAVPSYRGGMPGLEATNPRATGQNKLDVRSPESIAYSRHLTDKQDDLIARMKAALGRHVYVKFRYHLSINGLAVELNPSEAARVAELGGVKSVVRDWVEYVQTDVGPAWVGAPGVWDGSATGGPPTMGEGIIVGILDTGTNHDHPSFADVGEDGYDHTNPWGADNYTGWCDPANDHYTTTVSCNDKLIGLWSFDEDLPEDYNGHGTHVGSTAAGNVLSATFHAPTTEITRTISGVAPHANIIGYSIEGDPGSGSAPGTSILAATEQAISDTVDVINYSFGGGPGDPWATAEHWLNVRDAGIFVATSAGNEGPDPGTVGSPGNAPWMLTVANSTHNRRITNSLVGMTPDGPAGIEGKGVTAGYGPAEIVYAGHVPNPNDPDGDPAQCLEPYPAGTFDGEIVVCDRGEIARVLKGWNVLQGGAGGFVLANTDAEGESIVGDAHYLPAVHIGAADAELLRAWLTDTTVQTATITGYQLEVNDVYGDIMSGSSSRGPNYVEGILKPEVTAPGTDILAAVLTDPDDPAPYPEFDFYSGTSMASPHVAGIGALVKAVHPTWTPAQIQSAIMATAINADGIFKEDGTTPADPFDRGSGRAYASDAANAGLLLDETTQNFVDADPTEGGDPTTLNLAALTNGQCLQECSWQRTFSNSTGEAVTWEITFGGAVLMTSDPVSFTVPAGGEQMVTFSADVSAEPNDVWLFGRVILTPDDAALSPLHLPVAVTPSSGVFPDLVEINTRRNAGSQMIEDLMSIEVTDLTVESFGLVQADLTEVPLGVIDNYPDFPDIYYANLDDAYAAWIPVPAGAKRLVAEVTDTTSPDLDMLVAYDANGNDVMDLEDTALHDYCQSAASGPWEYCDITSPDAGDWYVIVINFEAAVSGTPDPLTLATAVVPDADAGNMTFEGPTSVGLLEPFDLRLFWDTPTMVAGDRWYGSFSLGSAPGSEGDIGTIPVNVIRHADDVVKTASRSMALPGDVIDYTITVLPNVTPEDLTYALTDTIPAGLTYVPGSATATQGLVDVTGDTLTWTGVLYPPSGGEYRMTTSSEDAGCAMPFANSGAYVDLRAFDIYPDPGIYGDTVWYTWETSGEAPIQYYGTEVGSNLHFADDGFAFFDPSTPGTTPGDNQDIPNPNDPNNLLAVFWKDLEIVYEAQERGVTLVNLTTDGIPTGHVLDYKGIQVVGNSSQLYDAQFYISRYVDDTPGEYEIIFAYDNLIGDLDVGTIGLEDAAGTEGTKYAYNDAALAALTNGTGICFDWYIPPADPVDITYQVTVDEDATDSPLTNEVVSIVDNPGSLLGTTWFDLAIGVEGFKDVSTPLIKPGDLVTYTIVLTGATPGEMWEIYDPLPSGLEFVSVEGGEYHPGTGNHYVSWSGHLGSGVATLLEEDFDVAVPPALPGGWAQEIVQSTPQSALPEWATNEGTHDPMGADAHSAPNLAYFNSGEANTGNSARLWTTAPLDLSVFSDAAVSFYMYHDADPNPNDRLQVQVSTNGTDWEGVGTTIWRHSGTEGWAEHTIDLSAYDGVSELYVGFLGISGSGSDIHIDGVQVQASIDIPSHTITIVMAGDLPGYYTNVAEGETQDFEFTLEAPELRVFAGMHIYMPLIFKDATP